MNIEIIDKWLDEEYGVSYTKLEELHDFYFEKYADHKEEIKELQERINKAIFFIKHKGDYLGDGEFGNDLGYNDLTDLLYILEGVKNDK